MKTYFAAAFLALSATAGAQQLVTAQPPVADQSSARRIQAHVEFLASDGLEGRDTGSRGYAIAADYVASQYRALGLEPAGDKGSWFQQVPFRRASYEKQPKISLTVDGRTVPLVAGKDAAVRPSVTQKLRTLSARMVYAGYGLTDRQLGFDDYAGLDLKGKVAVVLTGTPSGLPSDIEAHLSGSKAEFAAAAGAIGIIEIGRNSSGGFNPAARGGRPLIDWVDSKGQAGLSPAGLAVNVSLSREWAAKLFDGAPRSLDAVRKEAKDGKRNARLRGFPLRPLINVEAQTKWEDFTSPEVVGLLRGSDPALAAEHVVLTAHLDHLGTRRDAKPGEDAIYNGALDNAAGIATLLEAARHFTQAGQRPRRSILFVANTGEEQGLLGADYYAAHPTVPAQSIVGLVDLDMPLLLYPFTDVIAFGADHSTIGAAVAAAGQAMGIAVSPDPMPEEAIFTRSDHYRFVRRGVPAVLLMTGHGNGGKAHWQAYLNKVYHSPQDDLSQAIDWQAGARYALLNYRIARTMADAPQRPLWLAGNYFGDRFNPNGPRAPANPSTRP
ncbi:M20/M25/M40 family metallo-hydrolase [Sphingomonas xanthus]|uniref:M20/M25/M40 family metallo-hydrolase n=1 Tax=Sphingomonas xanthus TaxID=2594473 RepID=A0A516IS08_9SPHN|nr:M20/M25/M40 family metallo-hydrolase [Sphingomonas xanthus]QDP19671.1 M20/M25/M40 family metallo-hydrolase [Sphingomonas xanthus]